MSPLMSPDDFQSEMFAQGGLTTLNQGNLANIVPYIPPDGHHICKLIYRGNGIQTDGPGAKLRAPNPLRYSIHRSLLILARL